MAYREKGIFDRARLGAPNRDRNRAIVRTTGETEMQKPTWADIVATIQRNYDKRQRAWRKFMARTTKLAALADPRTGGNECLCRNWGNEESRRIWADGWKRWRAYSDQCDKRYSALMAMSRNAI